MKQKQDKAQKNKKEAEIKAEVPVEVRNKYIDYLCIFTTVVSYLLYIVSQLFGVYFYFRERIYITFSKIVAGKYSLYFPIQMEAHMFTLYMFFHSFIALFSFYLYMKELFQNRKALLTMYDCHVTKVFFVSLVFNAVGLLIGIFQYCSDDFVGMQKDGRNFTGIGLIFTLFVYFFADFGKTKAGIYIQKTLVPSLLALDVYYINYVVCQLTEYTSELINILDNLTITCNSILIVTFTIFAFIRKNIVILINGLFIFFGIFLFYFVVTQEIREFLFVQYYDLIFSCIGMGTMLVSILVIYYKRSGKTEFKTNKEKEE